MGNKSAPFFDQSEARIQLREGSASRQLGTATCFVSDQLCRLLRVTEVDPLGFFLFFFAPGGLGG